LRSEAIALQKYLERQVQQVVETSPGTARVTLTVTRFEGGGGPRGAVPKVDFLLAVDGPNDRVRGNHRSNPDYLLVQRGGPVNLSFTIVAGDGTGDAYFPVGISFAPPRARRRGVVAARGTFTPGAVHIYGTTLYFTDNYDVASRGNIYEFSVAIQRSRDGRLGVIDPGIVHIPPMPPNLI
jgi:hypothetical protein